MITCMYIHAAVCVLNFIFAVFCRLVAHLVGKLRVNSFIMVVGKQSKNSNNIKISNPPCSSRWQIVTSGEKFQH